MILKNDKAKSVFLISAVGLALNSLATVSAQYEATRASCAQHRQPEWFQDAKLGIFIHWGIYSVNGIDESWSFHNGYISYEDYMKQLDGFTAQNYKQRFNTIDIQHYKLTNQHINIQ